MSESGLITVRSMITLVRQESDMEKSNFVKDDEIAAYISSSYKELYDLLVTAYGEDYEVATPVLITTNSTDQLYPLPDGTAYSGAAPFYKLLGLDFQLNVNDPQGYITLKTFPFSERNRFAVPNAATFWGRTNLRYRLQGTNLFLTPLPAAGEVLRMWYIPRPVDLVTYQVVASTMGSPTLTSADTSSIQVGSVVFNDIFAKGTTVLSKTSSTVVMSTNALITKPAISLTFVNYDQTIDGISGWEEYLIVDSAIKCKDKEESDIRVLVTRKEALKKRIEGTSANRDPGSPARTADVSGTTWNNGDGDGGGGYGGGY